MRHKQSSPDVSELGATVSELPGSQELARKDGFPGQVPKPGDEKAGAIAIPSPGTIFQGSEDPLPLGCHASPRKKG